MQPFNKTMKKLSAKLSKEVSRRPFLSYLLIPTPDYMYRMFSVQKVTILLNVPYSIQQNFSIECSYIRLLYFEKCFAVTWNVTEPLKQWGKIADISDIAWLHCYVWHIKIILHHINLSENCVTFLVLSKWFIQWQQAGAVALNVFRVLIVLGFWLWLFAPQHYTWVLIPGMCFQCLLGFMDFSFEDLVLYDLIA